MTYTYEQMNAALLSHCYAPSTGTAENKELTERLTAIAEKILDSGGELNMAQAWKILRKEGWRGNKGKP